MAHGGHHGGGFHSGGHHSGGFHGGGFHGGGFGGGGFHSGSSFHSGGYHSYHGGSYDSDGRDVMVNLGVQLVIFAVGLLTVFYVNLDSIPGYDFNNTTLFVISGVLFFVALKANCNLSDISNFFSKETPYFSGSIYYSADGSRPYNATGSRTTWASNFNNEFAISFYNNETKDMNLKAVHETVRRTPLIVWASPAVWILITVVMAIINFGFYEAVIPYFENKVMTDEAFAFVDDFMFYLPVAIGFLSSLACLIFRRLQFKLLHECAKRIALDNKAAEDRQNTIGEIESVVARKWYYNECPNCGSLPPASLKSCPHCGTSLEVPANKEIDARVMHRNAAAVIRPNAKAPVKRRKDAS